MLPPLVEGVIESGVYLRVVCQRFVRTRNTFGYGLYSRISQEDLYARGMERGARRRGRHLY